MIGLRVATSYELKFMLIYYYLYNIKKEREREENLLIIIYYEIVIYTHTCILTNVYKLEIYILYIYNKKI